MKKILVLILVFLLIALVLIILYQYKRLEETGLVPRIPLFPRKEARAVNLYFASLDGKYLISEGRNIAKKKIPLEEVKEVLEELIKGPRRKELAPSLPEKVHLREVYLKEGIAYLDFTKELRESHSGGTEGELLTIYSLVNTLVLNFPEIEKVQILVEGKEVTTLAGHIDIRKPLSLNTLLLKER
jgi:spore germination protein GerM